MKVFTGVVLLLILVETLLMSRAANMFNNTEIKSIKAVRQIEELQHVPFYYPAEGRESSGKRLGRRILPWDVKKAIQHF